MSLANIQHLVLSLTIDPDLADRFYADPHSIQAEFGLTDQETAWASGMPRPVIEEFQATAAGKRSRRAESFFARTTHLLPPSKRAAILRDFARRYVMRSNQWTEYAGEYLRLAKTYVQEDSREANLTREIIAFEEWLFDFTREPIAEPTGTGYAVAATVRVKTFPFPAEPLITDQINKTNMKLLTDGYGTIGYVLAQKNGNLVDLYEIDQCYYNFIRSVQQPCTLEELAKLAQAAADALGLTKNPQEMIEELQEFGILIQLGEAN